MKAWVFLLSLLFSLHRSKSNQLLPTIHSFSTSVAEEEVRKNAHLVKLSQPALKSDNSPLVILPTRPVQEGTVSEPSIGSDSSGQVIFRHQFKEKIIHSDHRPKNTKKTRIREHNSNLFSCRDSTETTKQRAFNNDSNTSKNITSVVLSSFSPSVANLRCKRRSYGVGPPAFHPSSPTNVTAQLGANAYLPCRIRNLGNKSVSWFRKRDRHILTVDRVTFIADGRFSAWYQASIQSWTLHIRYVQPRDAGIYECQVSTEPKMSLNVSLAILKPTTTITGESDQYVRVGSTVTLRCLIHNATEEPEYIFWYQNGLRVVQAGDADRIISASRMPPSTSLISLTIPSVTMKDSGNYTCAPALIDPASVNLHILHDEHPAAMQHGTTNKASSFNTSFVSGTFVYFTILYLIGMIFSENNKFLIVNRGIDLKEITFT